MRMKCIIKKLWVVIAILWTAVSAHAYDFEVGGIYYTVLSATDLTCCADRGDVKYSGEVVIPSEVVYKGRSLKVTKIERNAFAGCTSLASVTIGDSVTYIEENAFEDCTSLTSLTIPDSVTEIDSRVLWMHFAYHPYNRCLSVYFRI